MKRKIVEMIENCNDGVKLEIIFHFVKKIVSIKK